MPRKHASPSSICHASLLHQRILILTPQQLLPWIRPHPACSTAVGWQQRDGTCLEFNRRHLARPPRPSWQEIRVLPGISGCSVPLWVSSTCGQPRGILGRSKAGSRACVQEQLGLAGPWAGGWTLCVCVCVWEETAQGRTKLNSMKNSCLELHSTGRVLWIAYENRWIFFFTEKIVLGASSLHGSICEFTLDHGSGHEGKKVMGYFHSVSPQLVPSAFLCSFIFPTASRAFLWIVSYFWFIYPEMPLHSHRPELHWLQFLLVATWH